MEIEEFKLFDVPKSKLKIGDKVVLKSLTACTAGFHVGDICTISRFKTDGRYKIEIQKYYNVGYVDRINIQKIEE